MFIAIIWKVRCVFAYISDCTGLNFSDVEANSLRQLSSGEIVEGVVLCLQRIVPESVSVPSSARLPPNMTARFRMCTAIADAIKV